MKQLLYLAFSDFGKPHWGVNSKILSQCRAFRSYGYDVTLIGRRGADTIIFENGQPPRTLASHTAITKDYRIRSVVDKQRQLRDIRAYIRGRHFDACYIRYDFSDPGFLALVKQVRRQCAHVALELPTYPYEDENRYSLLSRLKLSVDILFRSQLHRYVDFIVTFYGGFRELFGIPVVVIPNGFDYASLNPVTSPLPGDGIHIAAVSSMRHWHGYERIIDGLQKYYQDDKKATRNFILHLVGNGRDFEKYAALIKQYHLEDHVILEGPLHGPALDALYEICALGVDSLGRHRSGIHMLSSLKSREYGAKGLPMINSCEIDILGDDFPYLLRVSADESPIDMETIAAFYDRCFHSGKSRQAVAAEIRAYMVPRSDMARTLRPVVQRFHPLSQEPL